MWKREAGLVVPLGVAAVGQFLVLLNLESAYLDIWPSMLLHALPILLLWLGGWVKSLERLGLLLLALLTGFALLAGTETRGVIGACAAIPVLLAALFPTADWLKWMRLFSWPALGFIFAGIGVFSGEKESFLDSDASMFVAFGLLMASWSYVDSRQDWSFRKQRRVTHFTLLPMSLLMIFGSWADHVTHGVRVSYVGYAALPIAVMGIFGFDPFGPEEPKPEGGSEPEATGDQVEET